METRQALARPIVDGLERGEVLGWPTDGQSVWANAPHMTADDKRASTGQQEVVGLFESSVWYQLQLTLNAGMRIETDTTPMDWAYHYRHLLLLAEESGEPQALRYAQTVIKAYQARDNGRGPHALGWQLRFLHPWQAYSENRGQTEFFDALDGYRAGLRGEILGATVRSFVRMVTDPSRQDVFGLDAWPRRDEDDYDNGTHAYWFALERESYVPEDAGDGERLFEQPNYNHADAFFRLLPLLGEAGVDPAILGELRDWCSEAWPRGNWSDR